MACKVVACQFWCNLLGDGGSNVWLAMLWHVSSDVIYTICCIISEESIIIASAKCVHTHESIPLLLPWESTLLKLRPCSHHSFGTGTVPECNRAPVFTPVPLRLVVPERADHLAMWSQWNGFQNGSGRLCGVNAQPDAFRSRLASPCVIMKSMQYIFPKKVCPSKNRHLFMDSLISAFASKINCKLDNFRSSYLPVYIFVRKNYVFGIRGLRKSWSGVDMAWVFVELQRWEHVRILPLRLNCYISSRAVVTRFVLNVCMRSFPLYSSAFVFIILTSDLTAW